MGGTSGLYPLDARIPSHNHVGTTTKVCRHCQCPMGDKLSQNWGQYFIPSSRLLSRWPPSYGPCSSLRWGEEISFSKSINVKILFEKCFVSKISPQMCSNLKSKYLLYTHFCKALSWSIFLYNLFPKLFCCCFCWAFNSLWPHDCSMPGFPVLHYFLEFAQIHDHRVSDVIQPSYLLLSPYPPALNLSQHQGVFQGVTSLHQMAKVLELQLQHQSFQWIFRVDFL